MELKYLCDPTWTIASPLVHKTRNRQIKRRFLALANLTAKAKSC